LKYITHGDIWRDVLVNQRDVLDRQEKIPPKYWQQSLLRIINDLLSRHKEEGEGGDCDVRGWPRFRVCIALWNYLDKRVGL